MDIKDYNFHCPHCRERLNKSGVIVLNTKRQNGDDGRIRLATTFGNYSYNHEPDVKFNPGEIVNFSCPSCNVLVHSHKYKDYALLKMVVSENVEFDVLFSREAGKRKTYVVTEDGIESYSER